LQEPDKSRLGYAAKGETKTAEIAAAQHWHQRPLSRIVGILLFINVCLHFIGLSSPSSVVFDEVHFGSFITSYCCTGESFFDIHPPHAKLATAAVVKAVSNYQGDFKFPYIGAAYGDQPVFAFRLLSAIAGCLIPLAALWLLLELGASRAAAALGAFGLTFENGILLQTRMISLEGQLLLAELIAVAAYVASVRRSRRQLGFLIAAGVAGGWAVGTKLTGLVALSIPLIISAVIIFRGSSWSIIKRETARFGGFISIALVVYLAGWVLHFNLLDRPGRGDAFYKPSGDLWWDIIRFHKVMFQTNANLAASHDSASFWTEWIFMVRPIFYWTSSDARIYFLGNVVVWLSAGLGVFVALAVTSLLHSSRLILKGERLEWEQKWWLWVPFIAYFNAYLPYAKVDRALFLYHYLPPMMFGWLGTILWLDRIGWIEQRPIAEQPRRYFALAGLIVGAFMMMAPLTYGIPVPSAYIDTVVAIFEVKRPILNRSSAP
jgi:dolichyl-phosphate-mannose-protein mannosyltransferase